MRRKLTQSGPVIGAAIVLLAAVLVTAIVLQVALSQDHPETSSTVIVPPPSTTSTVPPSIPALASGMSADQVAQLLSCDSNVPAELIQVFEHETLGDWAVAKVYTRVFEEQHPEGRWGVVFQRENDAWFFKGSVSLVYGRDAAIELRNMDAPEQVWSYFGRSPSELKETTTSSPPDTPPFVALCRRFTDVMGLEKFAGTLPLSVMTPREMDWLRGGDLSVTVTDAHGYRLANGDLVILFFIEPVPLDSTYALPDALEPLAKKEYGAAAILRVFDETFGYVIASDLYRYRLEYLVQLVRQGLPLDY